MIKKMKLPVEASSSFFKIPNIAALAMANSANNATVTITTFCKTLAGWSYNWSMLIIFTGMQSPRCPLHVQ
jgi:hypothetical protein